MLRLLDARTGQAAEVRPRHPGELRILLGALAGTGLGLLRGYLIGDLIRRYAERTGLLPSVCVLVADGLDTGIPDGDRAALNIHPPQHTRPPDRVAEFAALFPGGQEFDVGVGVTADIPEVADHARHLIVTGDVRPAEGLRTDGLLADGLLADGLLADGLLADEADPLALRLALLGRRYQETTTLTPGDVAGAAGSLRRWRQQVARWAMSPSTAVSARYSAEIAEAFADDLRTGTALGAAASLEADHEVPDGTKFETFVAADRLLGLDLARDIGKT